MPEWKSKLIDVCGDSAAVILGVHCGVVALLREDLPWLFAIHCLNHHLELAAKDAFAKSYMDDVFIMLMNLYYQKSPKRLHELKEMGHILEESVKKPEKAHGTRWQQHKSTLLKSLILGYPVICACLESLAVDSAVKPADKATFQGLLE